MSSATNGTIEILQQEFTAKDVQAILRSLTGGEEKIGLALLNYYARTNLVPATGETLSRGRKKYSLGRPESYGSDDWGA